MDLLWYVLNENANNHFKRKVAAVNHDGKYFVAHVEIKSLQ